MARNSWLLRTLPLAGAAVLLAAGAAAAATKTLTVWPDQMMPADAASESRYERTYGILTSADVNAVEFMLPVKLPGGAVVQTLAFIGKVNAGSGAITVVLERSAYDTVAGPVAVANASLTGGAAYVETVDAAEPAVAKVLGGYRYWVRARVGNNLGFLKAVKITYKVP